MVPSESTSLSPPLKSFSSLHSIKFGLFDTRLPSQLGNGIVITSRQEVQISRHQNYSYIITSKKMCNT